MDIVLLRHTQSLDNELGVFSRRDTPLSKKGLEQLEELVQKSYPVKAIYSSPYKRSLVLAEALSQKLGIPLFLDNRLREIDFGDFEGKTYREIERLYPELVAKWMEDPWTFEYPGGEDILAVRSRARSFYRSISESSLIISHQAFMISLMAEVLNYNYKQLSRFQLGSGAKIHLRSEPWRLLSLENL